MIAIEKGRLKYFNYLTLLLFFVNLALLAAPNIAGNFIKTRIIKNEMKILKERKNLLINFSKTELQGARIRLNEAGVKFTDSDTLQTNKQELRTIHLFNYGPVYNK